MRRSELVEKLESEFTYTIPCLPELVGAEAIKIRTVAKYESELGTLVQRHYDDIVAHADLYHDQAFLILRIGQTTEEIIGSSNSTGKKQYSIGSRFYVVKDKDKYNQFRNERIEEQLDSEAIKLKHMYRELE